MKILLSSIGLLCLTVTSGAAQESAQEIFQKVIVKKRMTEQAKLPCPPGSRCALVDAFTKENYRSEVRRYDISELTRRAVFENLAIYVHVTREHAVIINTIKVGGEGRWKPYPQAKRLVEGKNLFAVPVPLGTAELVISFDHGAGSEIKVSMERPAGAPPPPPIPIPITPPGHAPY